MTNLQFNCLNQQQSTITSTACSTNEPRFIRLASLASTAKRKGRLPLSPASIWRLSRLGEFPKPVKLSLGITAWRLEDIEAWEAERCKTAYDRSGRKE
jgi:predicted DNA-binding transcriptional regulator AlpA